MKKLALTGLLAILTVVGLVAFAPRAAHAHGVGFHGGFHGGGFHGGGFRGGFHAAPAAHHVGPHFAGPRGYVGPRFGVVGPRYYRPVIAPRFGVRVAGPGYWGWHSGVRVWFGAAYPGPGFSWVPAHWEWNGASWYWQAGYWAPPVY